MIRYAGESLSTGLARELRTLAATAPAPDPAPERTRAPDTASAEIAELRVFLDNFENRLKDIEQQVTMVAAPPASDIPDVPFVLNRESSVFHRAILHTSAPASDQRSACGWKFGIPRNGTRGQQDYTRMAAIPPGTPYSSICPKCLRFERDLLKMEIDSGVD